MREREISAISRRGVCNLGSKPGPRRVAAADKCGTDKRCGRTLGGEKLTTLKQCTLCFQFILEIIVLSVM